MTDNCKHCGLPLPESLGKRQRIYCSQKCANKSWENKNRDYVRARKRRPKRIPVQRFCAFCEGAFLTIYPTQKYCRRICLKRDKLRISRANRALLNPPCKKTCERCGSALGARVHQKERRFCSKKCLNRDYYEKNRARLLTTASERGRAYYKNHREAVLSRTSLYSKTHPKQARAAARKHSRAKIILARIIQLSLLTQTPII